jgi:hypothetical protein
VTHIRLEELYEDKGMLDQSATEISKQNQQGEKMAPLLQKAYASAGARGYWQEMLRQQIELAKQGSVESSYVAVFYARLGDKDKAMEWLEKARAEHDVSLALTVVDPGLEPLLRSDPRFQNLLRSIRLAP